MPIARSQLRRLLAAATTGIATFALVAAPGASAAPEGKPKPSSPPLVWTTGEDGLQYAEATVPLSYANPRLGTTKVPLVKAPATGDPAQRIGSLFTNPGGPGGSGVDFVAATADSLYASIRQRYDVIGFDPRGTGTSPNALDCKVNQETEGLYRVPFVRPTSNFTAEAKKDFAYVSRCERLNRTALPYVTTGNVARDLDVIRGLVGDQKFNYLGYSYGTFLGATYAALFPNKLGRVVLDGPLDASGYINQPMANLRDQSTGFEDALDRFLAACKADQAACAGFGGSDPSAAYDALLAKADKTPIPADSYTDDPRPVDGDTIRWAVTGMLYAKFLWPYLAQELAAAEQGDGGPLRAEADGSWGNNLDGTFDPGNDRYFLIGAADQSPAYPRNPFTYYKAGVQSFREHPTAFYNNGFVEFNYALYGARSDGRYAGPFKVPGKAATPLIVATTHDPATPYDGAQRLVRQLGNARLLTMEGDNHTAYGGESACIDAAVDAYLFGGTLPSTGTVCQQETGFAQPEALTAAAAGSGTARAAAIGRFAAKVQPAGPATKPVDPAE
ncbi:MAG: alpha/beta fold hydrolase [Solirubrobacteraceae bacterium]|nr:alpha/beta fold hydrolase [Solirubrobacteraceae bacterium]